MSRTILTQSLFQTTQTPATGWRSYVTSGAVHAVLILLLFALFVPTVGQLTHKRNETITYLAPPPVPEYRPKIIRPHIIPTPVVPLVKPEPKPTPVIKPLEIKRVVEQPHVIPAPELKATVSAPRILPEPKFEAPAPKREIKTGVLETAEAARGPVEQKSVKTGGFGDPNGLKPTTNENPSGLMMAKVGSFDQPEGSGTNGGGGHAAGGPVRSGGFGSVDSGSASGGKGHGGTAVQTGGFGDSTAVATVQKQHLQPTEPALTPVEILSKPKPAYTDEARNLKLEGQVALEVVFLSNGSIRVVRVLHGLGHGLDEAAEQAALQVRFKPAMRGGVPVDMNATIKITFQLT